MKYTNKEIYEWLNTKNYQTEYEETGEYEMYFSVDMPKILNDFVEYIIQQSLSGSDDKSSFPKSCPYLEQGHACNHGLRQSCRVSCSCVPEEA